MDFWNFLKTKRKVKTCNPQRELDEDDVPFQVGDVVGSIRKSSGLYIKFVTHWSHSIGVTGSNLYKHELPTVADPTSQWKKRF